jgi:hypothetical protein
VGNLALAHYLGLHKWTSHDWARLRERLIPKHITPDLFVAAPAPAPEPEAPEDPPATATPQTTAAAPAAPPPAALPQAPATTGRRMYSRGLA